MKNTHIGNIVAENNHRLRYDAAIKRALSDKQILATILKYTAKEFEQSAKNEIIACIEGNPEVAIHKVRPGISPEEIVGMKNDSKIPGEGEITYDVIFYALTPGNVRIKVIVNVEAQKKYRPGYRLVNRATFYCARMLSEQLDKEFTTKTYDDIKKVYSIWVCMDVPQYAEYSIAKYHMVKEDFYGNPPENGNYDLLEVVMIYLGDEKTSAKGNSLHRMLSILLSETMTVKEKKNALDEYGIKTSRELEGGLEDMCNLGELLEERATARGLKKGLEKGLEKGLYALVNSLRSVVDNNSKIHEIIVSNPDYRDITLEQVENILHELC